MDPTQAAAEQLQEKWSPIIEHTDMPKIEDTYKRRVTAILSTKLPTQVALDLDLLQITQTQTCRDMTQFLSHLLDEQCLT